MDLKSRLAQLDRSTRKPVPPDLADPVGRTGNQENSWDQESALASLGLHSRETDLGRVWVVEHRDDVLPLADVFPDMQGLFTREPSACPAMEDLLLMDTETTGLAGGTGTLVFQLGVSWWRSETLVTRQYFLPGPAHEAAMLSDLADLAQDFTTVVTFNGASFDLPLLRTRALLNRLPDPFAELTSWDLLVPSRRMWSHCLPDCRQQTVEQLVCGITRGSGDIDGSRIPQTWFDFLSTGDPGELSQVLTHNHRDMVGMARILGVLGRIGHWLAESGGAGSQLPPQAGWRGRAGWWALGKTFERRSEARAAGHCFQEAWRDEWDDVVDSNGRLRFRRDAVRNLKRCQAWELVAEIIADGLAEGCDDFRLHREAAILYEHRLVDLDRALQHAVSCGEESRQKRLRMRLQKSAGQNGRAFEIEVN